MVYIKKSLRKKKSLSGIIKHTHTRTHKAKSQNQRVDNQKKIREEIEMCQGVN